MGIDTFCPARPWTETELRARDLSIIGRVSGKVRKQSCKSEMLFSIEQLISCIGRIMTFEPRDVILTGTPEGVGILAARDVVEVEIEGLGYISNRVE